MKYQAVAFDLDGTLYPNIDLYARLIPFMTRELSLLRALGKARNIIRKSYSKNEELNKGPQRDFYDLQAGLMGEILGRDAEEVRERTERLIYRGWEPLFTEISLFPHVRETLEAFRNRGIKLGILSDFPLEKKLENLGISGFWDTMLCSEFTGFLKPNGRPFLELAGKMGFPPEEMLYVGNSVPYDVIGAVNAGMKAALIRPIWGKFPPAKKADFVFYDYRQLRDYVLG